VGLILIGWSAVGNVRFGSKADISHCNRHVRFTPESGHLPDESARQMQIRNMHAWFEIKDTSKLAQ
jgi:hypothetical protein